MQRKAGAVWKGGLKDGKGTVTTASGVLTSTPYSFSTRFEEGKGTNPEELIAAAHAGCFSMALAFQLSGAGFTVERIHTTAKVHFEQRNGGWSIHTVELQTEAAVPGIDAAKFTEQAQSAKKNCPVSRALAGVAIQLSAKLI